MATTIRFSDDDHAAIIQLAKQSTGGNQAAAIRQAVRDALRPPRPTPYEDRYRALMQGEYRALRFVLSQSDLMAITDACNGWLIQPHDITMIWSEVEDYLEGLDDKARYPGMTPAVLVDRLRGLTSVQCHALVYALEDARQRASMTGEVSWNTVLGGPLRGPATN